MMIIRVWLLKVVCILIKNFDELITRKERAAREKALKLIEEGLLKADPKEAVKRAISFDGEALTVDNRTYSFGGKLIVVGAGKAAGSMAEAVEERLGSKVSDGAIITPKGTASQYRLNKIKVMEGNHPIPSIDNIKAAKTIQELVYGLSEDDVVLCLIAGGGSALLTLPAEGIHLTDIQHTTQLLLRSGASIDEVNAIRKHLSAIKGGQLAGMIYPARLISLIISDVVGDSIESIASGPTAPDTSTFMDGMEILQRYDLWNAVPNTVRRRLITGSKRDIHETPKPRDKIFDNVYNKIIASNCASLNAMCNKANELNLNPIILTTYMEGEARYVGRFISSIVREIYYHDRPIKKPATVIAGGETTVTVTGDGKGGRNQELVLGAALGIQGLKGVTVASMGSDGIDGACDAAGAVADGYTITRAKKNYIDPFVHLKNNDSHTFFSKLSDCIFTGRTYTNVNDFTVAVITD